MKSSLYRKHRPATFAEVFAQAHIKTTIQNQIAQGSLVHAYLFSGPRGIGKTTVARLIAKSVNCLVRTQGEYEPCNACATCAEALKGNSLNIIEIDAASHRGINEIKELREHVKYAPPSERFRTFIIDEAHMLTGEAFNALLKTLEEPPPRIIFILATTEVNKLPETIISRCQRFDFKRVPANDLAVYLKHVAGKEDTLVDEEILLTIARRSEGCVRDAVSMLGQILPIGQKISWKEASLVIPRSDAVKMEALFLNLAKHNLQSAIAIIHELYSEGVDLERFNLEFIEFLRAVLLYKISKDLIRDGEVSPRAEILSAAHNLAEDEIKKMIKICIDKVDMFKNLYELPQLPMELAAIEIISNRNHNENIAEKVSLENKNESESKSNGKEYSAPFKKITISHILALWTKFIEEIKKYNHSLPVALNTCEPIGITVENNKQVLSIGFKYTIHKKVADDHANKQALEKVLSEMSGSQIYIKTELKKDIAPIRTQSSENEQSSITEKQESISRAATLETMIKEEFAEFIVEN